MSVTGLFLTHILAREKGKSPFFFSQFSFHRMQKRGNTHYCFHCGGDYGFKPGPAGQPIDCVDPDGRNPMKGHTEEHATAVIGNADKYRGVWDWLEKELPKVKDFPYIVNVPSIF